MTAHRRLRLMRGAGAAIFATFVALMSHLLGGGMMPGALGIALPLGLALPLCLLLLERRASMPRLAVAVVASQVFFHVLFVVGSPGRATSTGGHLGHGAAGEVQVAIDAAAPSAHGNSTMWIWHVAAAVVTTFALGGGHAAIGRLADQWSAAWRSRVLMESAGGPGPERSAEGNRPPARPDVPAAPRRRAAQWRAPPLAAA